MANIILGSEQINGVTSISATNADSPTTRVTFTLGGSGGSSTWGSITGTLSNQTDLQTALNAKASLSKIGTISLSSTWTGSASPFSQVVTVTGATITSNSKVDIQADSTLMEQMIDDGCAGLYISNDDGVLTCYAILNALSEAMSDIQVCVTEVSA